MTKYTPTRLGEFLKKARIDAGYSILGVELETGISKPAVEKIENGERRDPRISTVGILLLAYNKKFSDLDGVI